MKTIGRRVCLGAGLSVAVVVAALGADLSAAGALGASEESSLGETPTHIGATQKIARGDTQVYRGTQEAEKGTNDRDTQGFPIIWSTDR